MKEIILIIFFTALQLISYSQNEIVGKVVRKSNKKPVAEASVYNISQQQVILTNEEGFFKTNAVGKKLQIQISAKNYNTEVFEINEYKSGDTLIFEIEEGHIQLDEVLISVGSSTLQKNAIVNVSKRSIDDINTISGATLGEMLENIPGVSQTSMGMGISKPSIRGLSGSRIVTYLNGLRIENQQWGEDHGMAVTELGIGSVEVIKGPASLLYGADALGGVLYFNDENYAPSYQTEVTSTSRFETNTMGYTQRMSIKTSGKLLRFNIYGGIRNHADYEMGNGLYAQNSRFKEQSLKTSVGFTKNKWVANLRYQYNQSRVGIPGHSHDSIAFPEMFMSDIQARHNTVPAQITNNHFALFENKFYLNKNTIQANLGFTSNHLQEHEDKITISDIDLKLRNVFYNINSNYEFNATSNLIVGSQGMHQNNVNRPFAPEIILPDLTSTDFGVYSLYTKRFEKLVVQGGLRYDWRVLNVPLQEEIDTAFNQTYEGLNYSGGIRYHLKKHDFRLNVSSGTRAPNASELLANGVHHGSVRYELGDRSLAVERSMQLDFAYTLKLEHFEMIVNPFYTKLNNFKYLENQNQFVDEFMLFEYKDAPEATIYGGELALHYHPHFAHNLHIESNIAYVRAYIDDNNNLPFIPQNNVNTQVKYDLIKDKNNNNLSLAVQHIYYADQNYFGTNETLTDSYQIINMGIQYHKATSVPFTLGIGVRNLLNETYFNHVSYIKNFGIYNPGRNFYISLKIQIINNQNK